MLLPLDWPGQQPKLSSIAKLLYNIVCMSIYNHTGVYRVRNTNEHLDTISSSYTSRQ